MWYSVLHQRQGWHSSTDEPTTALFWENVLEMSLWKPLRDTKQWHKLIRLYVIICAMREWKNRIFSSGSRVIQQQLPPFLLWWPTHVHPWPPRGTAESEQEVDKATWKKRAETGPAMRQGYTRLRPLPSLFCSLAPFWKWVIFHHFPTTEKIEDLLTLLLINLFLL